MAAQNRVELPSSSSESEDTDFTFNGDLTLIQLIRLIEGADKANSPVTYVS